MTTVTEKLELIESTATAALAQLLGDVSSPPLVPSFQKWAVPQAIIANEAGYNNEPLLIECSNGDIICLYRNAASHLAVGGKLVIRRSTDRGLTYGSPSVMFEQSGKDCRNQTLGSNPATGRLISFSRTTGSDGVTIARWKHISDDHGATWTTTQFTGVTIHTPYGRIVETSNGLCQLFYTTNNIVAMFSTDNGETWGNMSTIFNVVQTSASFCEPAIVAIDENRLVVVFRDDEDGGRYWYRKSDDGGATWSSTTVQGRWTASTGLQAAPANMVLHGNWINFAFDHRSPGWSQYVIKLDKETFWTNPLTAWATGSVVPGRIRTYVSKAASGTATGAEYGYVYQISLAEGVLRTWYDSKTGNGNTETCIHVSS